MIDLQSRTAELHARLLNRIYRNTDRLFLWLMVVQVVGAIVASLILSPRTYEGSSSFIHPHVIFATVMGVLIAGPAIAIALWKPGTAFSRHTMAFCQTLMSALLIHISGGRIETHFHVFGSLAFLALYRDWRILITATLVVAADHIFRGIYAPLSVYGSAVGAEWRFLEHAGWVVFEDVVLVISCVRSVRELKGIAERQAKLEVTNESIEAAIVERTDELRQTELRNSAILEHALDAIVTADRDGAIIEFNPAAAAMFEMSEKDALMRTIFDLFAPGDSREMIRKTLAKEDETLLNKRVELLGRRSEDRAFAVEASMIGLTNRGRMIYTIIVKDLSEQKELQMRVQQSNKLESLGRLATGVSHEVNTPNQYIGDNVRYVSDSFGDIVNLVEEYRSSIAPERREEIKALEDRADLEFVLEEIPRALGQALEGVDRVAAIVRSMKDFSHQGVQSLTTLDLNRVVTSTVTVARNEWKYVAEIEFDLAEDLPHIQGNPSALGQVVLNLVVNAAHAIKDRHEGGSLGLIKISTREEGEWVVMRIADDGGGIPESVQKQMFDPFFTTKGVGIGTGQGLAIVHSVVVAGHHGEIKVESEMGRGTEFVIRIPINGEGIAEGVEAA